MIYLDVDGVIADFEMGIRALGWTKSLDLKQDRAPGELERFMAHNYAQIFRTAPPTNHMKFFQQMYKVENWQMSEPNMKLLTAMGSHYKPVQNQSKLSNYVARSVYLSVFSSSLVFILSRPLPTLVF